MDRIYANIYFANSGADHAFCDFVGRSRLLLGSASNTFLYGCVMPNLRAIGALPSSSSAESVEIGRSGVSAMVRIASTYATLRLEGVGQSQNFTGFVIERNNITQSTSVKLGTVSFQTWGNGKNTFHRDTECTNLTASGNLIARNLSVQGGNDQSVSIVAGSESNDATLFLATPYDSSYSNYSKKCALIAEGLGFYSKSKFHICVNDDSTNQNSSATVSDSKFSVDRQGQVDIPGSLTVSGTFSNSDQSIKTNVRSLNCLMVS